MKSEINSHAPQVSKRSWNFGRLPSLSSQDWEVCTDETAETRSASSVLIIVFSRTERSSTSSGRKLWVRSFSLKPILEPLEPYRKDMLSPARDPKQGEGGRRQPHAGNELSAHCEGTCPGQYTGWWRYTGRMGQRHFHRPGDQKFSPKPGENPHPFRLAGIRCRGSEPGRSVDADVLRRSEPTGRSD